MLQVFTNCFSKGPFYGGQFFRNRLLQCSSPMGHKSCQELAAVWAPLSTGLQILPGASKGHSLLWTYASAPLWPPLWVSAPLLTSKTRVFMMGCRGMSALRPGVPPPLPSSLVLVSAELFPSHILTPLQCFLELAGIASVGYKAGFKQLLTEVTPLVPLLPKPCHAHPIHLVIFSKLVSCYNYLISFWYHPSMK